ncbi:MAG: hypothetical protein JOY90_06010 [Bradyrhizobium sp.]|uniref:hypothetical protein n=1 Tax=Bradyrhizobium sp. TaxID=376 RepID=UPI001DD8756E|nr:hypothetical protein [Bradyrhizobium sp.]MBV9560003.1 hypothetical protein [Bradyrhizobium sp.]
MGQIVRQLTNCHDCGHAVSVNAGRCPQCGSAEPFGPRVFSPREQRQHRIEARNDRSLAVITLGCGAAGAFYGLLTTSTLFGHVIFGCAYGLVGMIIGVAVAFVINITRGI